MRRPRAVTHLIVNAATSHQRPPAQVRRRACTGVQEAVRDMTEPTPGVPQDEAPPQPPPAPPVPRQASYGPAEPQMTHPPVPRAARPMAPSPPQSIGKVRDTGTVILLTIVTLGIYALVWYYQVHEEMRRHKGTGLGGGIALLLAIFLGMVIPFFTSTEAGELYERRGEPKPVSTLTGLWYFPGILILVGPIVWFVKTNRAINDYWRSLGAP
jgi:hypothetical protein